MAVANGNADFLLEDYPVISYQIKIGEQDKLRVAVKDVNSNPPKYGFAVKKGANPELIEMFNNGLAAIVKDGTYDKIYQSYFGNMETTNAAASGVTTTVSAASASK